MSIDFDTPGTDDEQPDWLTDSAGDDDPGDGDEGGGGGSRLFLIIAIGLIGLIVLGLFAVGGLLFIRNLSNSTDEQIAAATATANGALTVEEVVPTATFTPTPLPPTATHTPTIAPTNTRVVQENGDGTGNGDQSGTGENGDSGSGNAATPTPKPTNTPVPAGQPAGGASEVPNTGFGGFEALLIAIGLVGVLVISRRLRHAS